MADISAFKGLRYRAGEAADLSKVTAPPYDVIDADGRAELASRDPHNIVRLILPDDGKGEGRYAHAAELLDAWLSEGVLVEDMKPGIYVIRQEWQSGTERCERTGFVAAVALEPYGKGKIFPHENTMPAPKGDRLELLKATRANLSQIFSIFPDEDHSVGAWLTRVTGGAPEAESADAAGVVTKLWTEFDEARIAELAELMRGREVLIADGHHRYETALNYQRFCTEMAREAHPNAPADALDAPQLHPNAPQNAVMMLCVAMNNQGLSTLPTHRLLPADVAQPDKLIERLKEYFCVHPIATFSQKPGELDAILKSDTTPNLMVLYVGNERPPMTIRPRDDVELGALMPDHSETWRSLDVSILQYVILEGMLGLTLEHVSHGAGIGYVHDADEAKHRVDDGEFAAAFILRPTPVSAVAAVASHLEKMPPKSTFFYPKAVTGMVLRRLHPGGESV